MIDIVGTLTQPYLFGVALVYGIASGILGIIIKSIISPRNTVRLIIGDLVVTLAYFACFFVYSFFYTSGIMYAYTLLSSLIGYTLTYYSLKKLIQKILKLIQKKHVKQNKTINS